VTVLVNFLVAWVVGCALVTFGAPLGWTVAAMLAAVVAADVTQSRTRGGR